MAVVFLYKLKSMVQKKYFTEVVLLTKTYNLQDFKDWLHWHLNIIGFQHAHIFDNESSVDIKSVCDSYGDRVTYELIKGWPNQYALYNRYINNESPAWWVLPIDDDEFVYVSEVYNNNINNLMLKGVSSPHPEWHKLCIGWRNLFPIHHCMTRLDPHLILNATAWSDEASSCWQGGNRPVKTVCKTTVRYDWSDRDNQHRTHNPFVLPEDEPGFTLNGDIIKGSWQMSPTPSSVDIILYHYQFKSKIEWLHKCFSRISPGAKDFYKVFPEKFDLLYENGNLNIDSRMVELWRG